MLGRLTILHTQDYLAQVVQPVIYLEIYNIVKLMEIYKIIKCYKGMLSAADI